VYQNSLLLSDEILVLEYIKKQIFNQYEIITLFVMVIYFLFIKFILYCLLFIIDTRLIFYLIN
jgi:hypothetical protein